MYRIVASTSPSRFEAHAGLSKYSMKGIFDALFCDILAKSWYLNYKARVNTRDFTVVPYIYTVPHEVLL